MGWTHAGTTTHNQHGRRWNDDACRAMRMSCVCAWWCCVCHAMCSCLRGRLLAECGLCGGAPVRRHGDVHGDARCGAHAGAQWQPCCACVCVRGCDMWWHDTHVGAGFNGWKEKYQTAQCDQRNRERERESSRERAASCQHRLALLLAQNNVPQAYCTSWTMAECTAVRHRPQVWSPAVVDSACGGQAVCMATPSHPGGAPHQSTKPVSCHGGQRGRRRCARS